MEGLGDKMGIKWTWMVGQVVGGVWRVQVSLTRIEWFIEGLGELR